MKKKVLIILIIIIVNTFLVGFINTHYQFNNDAAPLSTSKADYTYEETWAIVEAEKDKFNYNNFDSFMASRGGYANYLRSLGGVFSKYIDRPSDFKVSTIAEYQEVALYTWGLMSIWGFDYSNGVNAIHHYWCGGKNGPFYPSFSTSRGIGWPDSSGIDGICSGKKYGKEHMTTCCNVGIEAFLRTAGLWNDSMEKVHITPQKSELRIGDYISFGRHVVIVGEINTAENTITLYDAGSRFTNSGNFRYVNAINDGTRTFKTGYSIYGSNWHVFRRIPSLRN